MDFRGWRFPNPDSMYTAPNSSSPFSANVSSFFRRPSKVVKSGSRNASPRHNGRRRTTSNAPVSRTRSLLDRQRPSSQQPFGLQQQGRPLSWHPQSYPDFSYMAQGVITEMPYSSQPQYMYGTTAVNGLVTPMTYPMPNEPQIQELITPLEELSAQEAATQYISVPYQYQYWTAPEMGKEHVYAMDNMFPQQQQTMTQSWQYSPQYFVTDVPTAPSSPTFLPIQGGVEASPLSLDTQHPPSSTDSEELVGMGLYDSPADVQLSNLFGGGLDGMTRKRSLKLEESFEPPPEASDAGDERETDAEDEADDEADDEPNFPDHQDQPFQPAPSMMGQSFFFESEVNANSVAYDPNMPYVQNGGYQMRYPGYGWV